MRKPRADMSKRYVSFLVSFTKSIYRLCVMKTFGLQLCVVLDYVHARSSGRCAFPLALSVTASRVGLLHSFRFKSISAWWQLDENPFAVFACVAILVLHQACFVARLLSAQIRSTTLAVFYLSSIKTLSGVHNPEQFASAWCNWSLLCGSRFPLIHFELDSGRLRWPVAIVDTRQHVYMSKWQTFAKPLYRLSKFSKHKPGQHAEVADWRLGS